MAWSEWPPYVSAAQRRAQASRKLNALKKQRGSTSPVIINGRAIVKSFWGKSWCENLERYSDFSNRLPRGRTYVRNGCVIDLQMTRGEVVALVSGSDLYTINIKIAPVSGKHWLSVCRDCAGSISSLVDLLQGKLSQTVMERVCRKGDGLFPAPAEIKLSCTCPDWAGMCKHVAAVMYGIGARLDENPSLLFTLRAVDQNELITSAAPVTPLNSSRVLADGDLGALFGIDMTDKPKKTVTAKKTATAKKASKPKRKI